MSTSNEHDERPWGSSRCSPTRPHYKVKQIVVKPGKRLSYQHHARRSEHWFVVAGERTIVLDGSCFPITPGEAAEIPRNAAHRIENAGSDDLVFIEVQHGDYFGEDDIVRLDDDFGRAGSA